MRSLRILTVLAVLASALAVTGCSKPEEETVTPPKGATSAQGASSAAPGGGGSAPAKPATNAPSAQ